MDLLALFPGMEQLQMISNLMGALAVAESMISYFSSHIITQISGLVNVCLTLYVIGYGLLLISGSEHVKANAYDVGIRIFKFCVVWILVKNFATYNNVIADFFWNLPEDLIKTLVPADIVSKTIGGSTTGTDLSVMLISTLMSSIVSIMTSSLQGLDAAGSNSMPAMASGMGVGLLGVGLTGTVFGILMVAKISLAILLGLGPFFIVTILFEKTKHFFDGWLTQILNFTLVLLLLSMSIYLLFPILLVMVSTYYLIAKLTGLTMADSFELMALLGIFILVFKQVPSTAASITKGYAVNTDSNPGQMAKQAGQ